MPKTITHPPDIFFSFEGISIENLRKEEKKWEGVRILFEQTSFLFPEMKILLDRVLCFFSCYVIVWGCHLMDVKKAMFRDFESCWGGNWIHNKILWPISDAKRALDIACLMPGRTYSWIFIHFWEGMGGILFSRPICDSKSEKGIWDHLADARWDGFA